MMRECVPSSTARTAVFFSLDMAALNDAFKLEITREHSQGHGPRSPKATVHSNKFLQGTGAICILLQ